MLQILLADELYNRACFLWSQQIGITCTMKTAPMPHPTWTTLGFNPGHQSETSALGKDYI